MRKILKKFLSIMLAVCMSAGFIPFITTPASAHQGTHGTDTVYANSGNMVNKVAAQMQKRRKRIVLYYHGSSASLDGRMASLYDISTPTSHQYTLDTMKDLYYTIDWSYQKKGWVKYILTPNYKLTDTQEAATQKKVKSILKKLHLKGTAYSKAVKLNDYLAKHVSYLRHQGTAYDALVKGKGNCQAYSEAFYLLALNSGIRVKMMDGLGGNDEHQWNCFKSGKTWYSIDTCWNKGHKGHPWLRKGFYLKDHKASQKIVRMIKRG